MVRQCSICLNDVSQGTAIGPIERIWYILQSTLYWFWAVAKVGKLTRSTLESTSGVSKSNVCPRYYGSHPVNFLCEHINDQLLVVGSPCLHFRIRVDNGLDIAGNVLLLSTLVM